jgi:hypothetical protein
LNEIVYRSRINGMADRPFMLGRFRDYNDLELVQLVNGTATVLVQHRMPRIKYV